MNLYVGIALMAVGAALTFGSKALAKGAGINRELLYKFAGLVVVALGALCALNVIIF